MLKSANKHCTNQNPAPDASRRTFEMDKDGSSIVASAATSWSKSETLLFIRKLEKYPCLYNQEDPNYTNKKKRFQKYNLLLEKIKKFKSDITFRGIKRKIRTLQIQLYKERKYSKKFGTDTDEVYKPKLWCYNELSFLFNSSPPEPDSSSIETPETQGMENNHASASNEPGWNREQTLLLLKELEKYPCLYNPTNKYFANRRKRNQDLNIMLPQIKKFKPDVTIDCIKKKIRALQGQLCKEARISRQTLTGPDEVYEPKLWCYNELSFMVQCRDSSNLELSEESETEEDKDDLVMEQTTLIDFGWTRPQTLSLIRELQKYPCLYNPADSEFKNITIRKAKINLMVAEVKKYKPDVTFSILKGRIKTLRCQLWKERKRSQKCRADTEEQEYKPKLWCYNELLFMNDCYNLQQNASTLTTELCKKSTDVASTQLDNDSLCTFKIDQQFVEEDPETRSKSSCSYDEFEMENLSNEYCVEENFPEADSEEDNENSDIQNLSETQGIKNNHASTSNEPGWKREQTLLLLKELEKYPCLYNPTNKYFANRRKRNQDLNIMLPQIKKFKPDVTINCIKKKIRALQGQLCKEARISRQTLTGPDEVYEPKLWCYNELSFMVGCRDSSNLELSEEFETEEDKDDLVMEQKALMDSGWTRPQTLSLIRELQKYPCLYNPADSEFKNITIRKAKINLMVAEVKKYKPDVTFSILKGRIKTLRCQLWKERKRSQKCRADTEEQEYKPKLWCYNELLFMNDCYNLQPNASTLTTELCKKSTDAASTQLNNESLCTFKTDQQFVEEDPETRSKPSRSYDEFEMENLSNEYSEVENFPEADSEEDNENSGIQNLSEEEDFCRYLCSQFKKIQLDENLEELKLEILQLVSKKIIEEKRAKQEEKYFEISPVPKSEIDPLTQSASPLSCSTHSMKLPVSKVIENKSNKTISEIERNKKWSSTSPSSIYSTTIVPMVSSMDKIGNKLPKRTFMELSDKRFIKEATSKREKLLSLSPPKLTSKDPLALAMENAFVEEYLDYE